MPLHVEHAPRPITLAWLDAEEAILLRCPGIGSPPGDPVPERLSSDVPSRHRAPGHVRHDPRVRPGGGIPDDRLERRREQLLESFLHGVAARIPPGDSGGPPGPGSRARTPCRRAPGRRFPGTTCAPRRVPTCRQN